MTRKLTTTVTTLLLLAALAGSAQAGDGPQAPTTATEAPVELTVTVIHASKNGSGIDPKLSGLKRHLERSFKDFTKFGFLGRHDDRLQPGGSTSHRVVGKELKVTYLDQRDGVLRMEVQFAGARMTMRVKDGGLWFHAGRKHEDGILVLALTAKTTGKR